MTLPTDTSKRAMQPKSSQVSPTSRHSNTNNSNTDNSSTDNSTNQDTSSMTHSASTSTNSSSKSNKQNKSINKFSPHPASAWVSWRTAVLLLLLIVGIVLSTRSLLNEAWSLPLSQLFVPSHQLSIVDMAAQLRLVATSLVAIMAGGLLGVVSILLQQLVKNPLASDTTLAIGTGAQLALLVAILFVPSVAIYGGVWLAFFGAITSLFLVFILSAPSRFNPLMLVLSGLVVNILFSAIAGVMVLFFTERSVGIISWSAGFLSQTSWQTSIKLTVTTAILAILSYPLLKPLTLMSLDDLQAKRLGVPLNAIRIGVILVVAVVTALVISELGLIGFIGLGAATLVNALGVVRIGQRLIAGFVFGALLLWLTSNVTLLLESMIGMPIPAGSVTGILGAPLIIWLVLRQRRQGVETIAPMVTSVRKPINWWGWGIGLVVLIIAACLFVQDLGTFGVKGFRMSTDWALTQQYRLPRTLSAAATGVMLAIAGVLLQTLTRNPMASPEVLGISSGAALGVIMGFIVLPMFGMSTGVLALIGSGLLGALLVLILIIWLAQKVTPAYLLLVGIGIGAMMEGFMALIKLSGNPKLTAMLSWLSGTTYSARPETTFYLIGMAFILVSLSLLLIKPLRVLGMGQSVARSLGVAVKVQSLALLVVVAGLSTISTLAVGPLSFIGLMVPHLATSMGAVQLEKQLPLAALMGAGVMVIADWIGRYVIFPYELPAGVVAAIIGGMYFLWLIWRTPVSQY